MNRTARILVLVGVLAIAAVGFVALRPAEAPERAQAPPGAGPSTTPTSVARPAVPPPPVVRVRDGRPVGGIERISVSSGERVRFVVLSDAADEIHVHGYDIRHRLPAGRPTTVSFPARLEGVFEVEVHSGHQQVASIRVTP